MDVKPFEVRVTKEVLDDLRERLDRTRWPDEVPGAGWDYGTNCAYMREWVGYWESSFDWREQEQRLNRFTHFRAEVDGFGLHFIHERGKGDDPMPLVLTHGWPSTFFEFSKIVPLLTNPESHGGDAADAFDVVVPSLPGFGFSDRPKERDFSRRIPGLWVRLMEELGYTRFAAHGVDVGTSVVNLLGLHHPDRLVGIHVTYPAEPYLGPGAPELSEREREFLEGRPGGQEAEGGYTHIQRTKPQTLSYSLNDSPTGLAGWILEKFRTWSDCDGDVERRFSKDQLLDNVMLYRLTGTAHSAGRLYYEAEQTGTFVADTKVEVPVGVAAFPAEIIRPPRRWAEPRYDIRHWTEMPRGGHFAAFEEPELLVRDVREFFRPLRIHGGA